MDAALYGLLATRVACQSCGACRLCFNMVDQYRGHCCALGRYKSLLGLAPISPGSCWVLFLQRMALPGNLAL